MSSFQQSADGSAGRNWASKLTQSVQLGLQEMTARKYTLPDKNVASQLLMYRQVRRKETKRTVERKESNHSLTWVRSTQLLHTKCRPGLKLSRDYQGTPAQVAVKHMPWWSEGCEETRKMIISYDNLIQRLWIHGCPNQNHPVDQEPPIPHDDWVHVLGFQQTDPVTDFRSGGVLSLAMMVHLCESCGPVFSRFIRPTGDASVLPFGITSINITDMLSRFLMLSKAVDRMDALLSQKTFWRMFADPNALLTCQELSMDMLADVVVELQTERRAKDEAEVTVFDFTTILETTERRVQYDLLGAGPKTVDGLRKIHGQLKIKYAQELQVRLGNSPPESLQDNAVLQKANQVAQGAQELAGNVFQRLKQAPNLLNNLQASHSLQRQQPNEQQSSATDPDTTVSSADALGSPEDAERPAGSSSPSGSDSDWAGTEIQAATDGVTNFSIGGDDDEEDEFL